MGYSDTKLRTSAAPPKNAGIAAQADDMLGRLTWNGGGVSSGDHSIGAHTKGRSPWPLDRRRYTERWRADLPNDNAALNQAVEQVRRFAGSCGADDECLSDIDITLREALANAMFHGNAAAADKRVSMRCYAAPHDGILIIVEDEGPGFDPLEVPDPRSEAGKQRDHGRGLLLMRELLDHIEYRKHGSEVVLYKRFGD